MSIDTNIILRAFPITLANDIHVILDNIPLAPITASQEFFTVRIHSETLHIPHRIYCAAPDPALINELMPQQSKILCCLLTRHHSGYMRELYLKQLLLPGCCDVWIIPYVIRLLGEYVIEILQVINDNLHLIDTAMLRGFIKDNPEFIKTTESRVMSYWNEYYRLAHPRQDSYVGFKILNYFDEIARNH